MSKLKVGDAVRFNAYHIIARAVDEGIEAGWRHAHKHTDQPLRDTLMGHIEREVIGALCEVLIFNEPADPE